MTVPSTASEISYATDGVSVNFPIPFPFDTSADIVAKLTDSSGNIAPFTAYSVTGGSGSTGTLTTNSVLASGSTLTIYDDPEQSQETDYVDNDPFPASSHEGALDKLTRLIKRLSRRVDRSLRTADGDPITDLTLGSVDNRKGKYLFFNAVTGAIEYAVSLVTTALSRSIIGQLLNPQTTTEAAAFFTPSDYAYSTGFVRRANASDAGGVTDSTAAIQAAINSLNAGATPGGTIILDGDNNSRYNISNTLTIPKYVSGDNHSRAFTLRGLSLAGPRLVAKTGLASKAMIDGSGNSVGPVFSLYRSYRDFYLNCAGIAETGLDLERTQHGSLENIFITGTKTGSGTAAGVKVFGMICQVIRGLKVHNGEGYGFAALGGSGNFFNANEMHGFVALDMTLDGMYFSGGVAGCKFSGMTLEACRYGVRFAGFGAGGNSFQGYFELNRLADVLMGEDTTQRHLTLHDSYCNGYSAGITDATYTPVKMKSAFGCVVRNIEVAIASKSPSGYLILDASIAGGSIVNCIVENCSVIGLADNTPPNQLYNLPSTWVDFGNALYDEIFAPLVENNPLRGRLPYGGWSFSVSGAGTAARSSDLLGAPTVRLTRPAGGDTASMSQVVSPGSGFFNRFVTLAIPVKALIANKTITVDVTPNGTSPQVASISRTSLGTNEISTIYAMVFAPADATQFTISITCGGGGDFQVGQPCLYVGARRWYSADCDQDWVDDNTPTTGAWVRGDKVYKRSMAASTKMGVTCVTGGSPGTWKDMPSLGA